MAERVFNNADSFSMAFDEQWEKINCEDINLKISKTIENLSDHPFVINNPELAKKIADFRVNSLKRFN
tara:strand:+ start:48 stop:251 length:204 start_codon:yes stop_codon:yes gene_type:complete